MKSPILPFGLFAVLCLFSLAMSGNARAMEAPKVVSIVENNSIVWSNAFASGTAVVEWAPTPDGPWSNTWQVVVPITGAVMSAEVPMFFRVLNVPDCDDGNPCTFGHFDPELGCVHTPVGNGTPCDDASACTYNDQCLDGACVGIAVDCDDGNACTLTFCDPALGCVSFPLDCDDGNPCTTDACDPATGCVYSNNSDPCDDGDPNTIHDTCSGGVCAGVPL